MLLILAPALVAVVGLLLYAFATTAKPQRIGEILFFVGTLWLVYGIPSALGSGAPMHVGR